MYFVPQASGYRCVIQESMLGIRIGLPSDDGGASRTSSSGRLDVEVTNRHLMGILTHESLALLLQLAAQVREAMSLFPRHTTVGLSIFC